MNNLQDATLSPFTSKQIEDLKTNQEAVRHKNMSHPVSEIESKDMINLDDLKSYKDLKNIEKGGSSPYIVSPITDINEEVKTPMNIQK